MKEVKEEKKQVETKKAPAKAQEKKNAKAPAKKQAPAPAPVQKDDVNENSYDEEEYSSENDEAIII